MTVECEASAASNVTCGVFAYNYTTLDYDYVGAFPLTGTDVSKSVVIPKASLANFVNGSREMKIRLRAISPISATRVPVQFNFRIDKVNLSGVLN
jgi:hypothetical protein